MLPTVIVFCFQAEDGIRDLVRSRGLGDVYKRQGLVAMCGHTRRFNPSHQWVHRKVQAGEFAIQQMDVQTYFFRRSNMNALGLSLIHI